MTPCTTPSSARWRNPDSPAPRPEQEKEPEPSIRGWSGPSGRGKPHASRPEPAVASCRPQGRGLSTLRPPEPPTRPSAPSRSGEPARTDAGDCSGPPPSAPPRRLAVLRAPVRPGGRGAAEQAQTEPPFVPEAPERTSRSRLIGEALELYVLVQQGDSLIVIDKHAAHERIIYDRLRCAGGGGHEPGLLEPAVLLARSGRRRRAGARSCPLINESGLRAGALRASGPYAPCGPGGL